MKIRENSPFVIGGLLCILGASLFSIIRFFQNGESGEHGAEAAAPQAASTRQPERPAATPVSGTTDRDPFLHPSLFRGPQTEQAALMGSSGRPISSGIRPVALTTGLPPLKAPPNSLFVSAGTPIQPPQGMSDTDHSPPVKLPEEDPEQRLVRSLRLTAIIDGSRRMAVIETAGSRPATVGMGDRIGTLQVTRIAVREIVLSGEHGVWTLPIEISSALSSAPEPAPSGGVP